MDETVAEFLAAVPAAQIRHDVAPSMSPNLPGEQSLDESEHHALLHVVEAAIRRATEVAQRSSGGDQ